MQSSFRQVVGSLTTNSSVVQVCARRLAKLFLLAVVERRCLDGTPVRLAGLGLIALTSVTRRLSIMAVYHRDINFFATGGYKSKIHNPGL